jgi:hypothetical protein
LLYSQSQMKILHILSELQFSGAELMLYTASDKFKQAGLDITVLSTGKEEGVYAQYFRKVGWKVIHIPFRKRIGFFTALYKLVRRSSFDVVHIHTEGAFIYKAFTVYMAGTKKIVSTVHSNFLFGRYLTGRRKLHHCWRLSCSMSGSLPLARVCRIPRKLFTTPKPP